MTDLLSDQRIDQMVVLLNNWLADEYFGIKQVGKGHIILKR